MRETGAGDPVVMTITHVPPAPAAIAVEGLTKRYGELRAVDDLSFSVRAGAVTGFLGPNGAGKTTALKAIVGIARPTAGRALIDGTPVEAVRPDARSARRLHRADRRPSGPLGAQPPALARGAGRAAGRPRRRGARARRARAGARAVGVGTYSTGMRQRLGLAAALLGDPRILVLDEPLNGLDPQGIRWLRTFLRERRRGGTTVLLSSHVLTEAAQTVDDVVVIHHGRLVHQGSIGELARLGGSRVLVRTPTPERLAAAVRAGRRPGRAPGRGRLLIEGMDAAQVGELAHDERVVLHELAPHDGSLEQVFFSLTEEVEAA